MQSRRLGAVAVAAALALGLVATAQAEPLDVAAGDVAAAYPTDPCDDRTTAADAALASQFNRTLTGKMDGYMNAYKVSCARVVTKAVRDRGMSRRAAVIAVTTVIVETALENINVMVDHTSLGLFQQQNDWGTREQRMNPTWATNKFLDVMVDFYPHNSWSTAPVGEVCQRVQRSAHPSRYQPEAADAQKIVDALWPYAVEKPHGPVFNRTRWEDGPWDATATVVDPNPAVTAIAATCVSDGTIQAQLLIPGVGVFNRTRWVNRDWSTSVRIDTNGSITDIASAAAPDKALHVQTVVPGAGVYNRTRNPADGRWSAATRIDTNPYVSAVSSAVTADGALHVQVVVPGAGVFNRTLRNGVWSASKQIDTNPYITALSAAAPKGVLHVQMVVPDAGVYDRYLRADGTWSPSGRIDFNGDVVSVSAAALPTGEMHVNTIVPGAGVWDRYLSSSGVWTTGGQVDRNGTVFDTYTAGLPNLTIQLGTLPDLS
jgi:hypothetical protein